FDQHPRVYSPNIEGLRDRLRRTNVHTVALVLCDLNHFTAYYYSHTHGLEYGDSLGSPPNSTVVAVLQWILSGLDYPIPSMATKGWIATQGPRSGSCGIAALNFIESKVDVTISKWNDSRSRAERDRALCDLVLYH
ncbi:hypothetical protein JAAARDRAFT_96868, partial [Jaapia argillacea MUCL 33604]